MHSKRSGRLKTLGGATGVLALSMVAAGCSSPGDEPGKETVTFWQFDTAQASIDAYTKAIAEFEKQNPDIKVDMQIVPWADQQQKITTAVATGSLPDVSMLGNNVVAQFAASGHLKPLDDYLAEWSEAEGTDVLADMYEGDKNYYVIDGKLYGAPVADETRMLYYNTELFQEAGLDPAAPPTTWEEMQTAAEALKSTGAVPWSAPMSKQYITVQTFMSVYLSYGARLFDDQGSCGLNTPEFKDALTYYTGIAKAGLTSPDAVNATQDDVGNLFSTGQAAMLIEGPGTYTRILNENPELADKIAVAPIPAGPKGAFGFLGGWPLVMWNSTDVPDAAAKWIHFATSPQGALSEIAQTSGILPGRISLASDAPWDEAPYSAFAEQLKNAYPYQYPSDPSPKMGQIETAAIQTAVQQVASGGLDVDEATSQMCATIDDIVAD
jgi:ABC-type glycerol-3-phosphate transport system substrate-binding protein